MGDGIGLEDIDANVSTLEEIRKQAADTVLQIESSKMWNLHEALAGQSNRRSHAARLLSAAGRGTGKWMTGYFGLGTEVARFGNAETSTNGMR